MTGDLSNRDAQAFHFASEVIKQVITLSTATFALTLTFLTSFSPEGADTTLLEVAWLCFLVSVVAGLFNLMTLAGTVASTQNSIYSAPLRAGVTAQVILFLAGFVVSLSFGLQVA